MDIGFTVKKRASSSDQEIFEEKILQQGSGVVIPGNIELSDQHGDLTHNDKQVEQNDEIDEEDETFWGLESEAESTDSDENKTPEPIDEDSVNKPRQLRDRSNLKAPIRYGDYALYLSTFEELETYTEAMTSDQRELWQEAIDCEMQSLKDNQT
ncbi:hypothetical protein Zmor_015033 [Zophobas morio]|uniref:Uncharacterized protein n=1 Tax=Zophobas morio TaxID=2755281 RepID=A0AA38MGW6_9CUCU|nr:hypothetical protein Zmor_015033 [Zophobas morio]